jgi:chromatin segregation and condensation protein Rec8/ScpA/Scc1 (kleisin family)
MVPLPVEQIPIETRIEQLLARLSETDACGFEDLFADVNSRGGMIVTFLALLEMIRLKLVRVFQSSAFGPIRVYKRAKLEGAPEFEGLAHAPRRPSRLSGAGRGSADGGLRTIDV